MPDKINITILEDGTISFNTDKVSTVNHNSADQFLDTIKKLGGGDTESQKKRQGHVHQVGHLHNKQ